MGQYQFKEIKPKESEVMTAADWKKMKEEIIRKKLRGPK